MAMTVFLALLFFTVLSNFSVSEVLADVPDEGAFHLKKYVDVSENRKATGQQEDITDSSNILNGKEALSDVVFEIYRTHDYIDGKLVEIESGAVPVLNNGENYRTDSNGEINIERLPLGQYIFKEVSAPDGIQINTEEYAFTLPYSLEDETELLYEVNVYPKNVRLTGSFSFKKVGDDGTAGLKNVVFQVYQEDGMSVEGKDGNALSVTTRLSGIAAIEDLEVGKYYIVETQNPDMEYLESNDTKYWFEIYSDKDEIKTKAFYTDSTMENKIQDADGAELLDGIIINYKVPSVEKTASAKSTKDITDGFVHVDAQGNLYANVDIPYTYTIRTTLPKDLEEYTKFEIYDAFDAGNIVLVTDLKDIKPVAKGGSSQPVLIAGDDYEVIREGTAGYRLKLTAAGIAKLASSKCTSVEVNFDAKIPKGYQVQGTAKTGENNDAVVEYDTNHSDPGLSANRNTVYAHAGEIIIHKVTSTDSSKLLAGAQFSLKGADGREYWGTEYVKYLDVKGKLTSKVDEAATFIFTQLPFGVYTLQETKAPAGYVISKKVETIHLFPDKDMTATWLNHEIFFENTLSVSESSSTGAPVGSGSNSSPKTGDETNWLRYIVGLSGGGIAAAYIIYRTRKGKKKKTRSGNREQHQGGRK